jgi:hypothetical protein
MGITWLTMITSSGGGQIKILYHSALFRTAAKFPVTPNKVLYPWTKISRGCLEACMEYGCSSFNFQVNWRQMKICAICMLLSVHTFLLQNITGECQLLNGTLCDSTNLNVILDRSVSAWSYHDVASTHGLVIFFAKLLTNIRITARNGTYRNEIHWSLSSAFRCEIPLNRQFDVMSFPAWETPL